MKLDRLETHDRYTHFTTQSFDIGEMCEKMISEKPFGDHAFYIYVHKKQIALDERLEMFMNQAKYGIVYTSMDQVPTDRLIWQPRLTKPFSSTNTMLFKVYPGSDQVKVIWMLPPEEMWEQYKSGKMTGNESVLVSIDNFLNHRSELDAPEDDDLPDSTIKKIYKEVLEEIRRKKNVSDSYIKV